jgi:TetR/AcrR family transcriptional repressor of nem operon
MGHSKVEKTKTHKRIVAIASKRFHEEGLAGSGIAVPMKQAGHTVGGFYKHFASRDDLVAEAPVSALEIWKRQINAAAPGRPPFPVPLDGKIYLANRSAWPGFFCNLIRWRWRNGDEYGENSGGN